MHNSWDIMKCQNQEVKQISKKHQFGLTFSVRIKMWETWRENTTLRKVA